MKTQKPKNSFVIHHDTASIIDKLTNEQAGELFKYLLQFSIGLNNPKEPKKPTGLNGLIQLIAHPFEKQLERDFANYQLACEKNAKNGKKGGRPKKKEDKKNPKKADNDNDNDNESDNEKDNNSKEKINKKEISVSADFTHTQPAVKESLTTQKQPFSLEFQEWYECFTEPKNTIDWNKPSASKEKLQKKFNQAISDIGIDQLMEKTKYYLLFKKYETSGTAKMGTEVFLNAKYAEDYKEKYEAVCKKQNKPLPIQQKSPEKQQEEVKMKEDTHKKRESILRQLNGDETQFMHYIKKTLQGYFSSLHQFWIDDFIFCCRNGVAYFAFTEQKYIDTVNRNFEKFQQNIMREIASTELVKEGEILKIELKLIN